MLEHVFDIHIECFGKSNTLFNRGLRLHRTQLPIFKTLHRISLIGNHIRYMVSRSIRLRRVGDMQTGWSQSPSEDRKVQVSVLAAGTFIQSSALFSTYGCPLRQPQMTSDCPAAGDLS